MLPHSAKLSFKTDNVGLVIPKYLFTATVVSSLNVDKNLFVYTRTDAGKNIFEGIASPHQLLAIPATNPDPDGLYPFKFRSDVFSNYYETATEINTLMGDFERRVDALMDSLDLAEANATITYVQTGILGCSHSTNSVLASS